MAYYPTAPIPPVDYYPPAPRRSHRWRTVGIVAAAVFAAIGLFLSLAIGMYLTGFSTPSRPVTPVVRTTPGTVPAWWSATAPPTTIDWAAINRSLP